MMYLSYAHGSYFFDFRSTSIKGDRQAQKDFIYALNDITKEHQNDGTTNRYYTNFNIDTIKFNDDVADVSFSGLGCDWYRHNVGRLINRKTDEYNHVSNMESLAIYVAYQDAEPELREIYMGDLCILVSDGQPEFFRDDILVAGYTALNCVELGFIDSVEQFESFHSQFDYCQDN